MSVMWNRTCKMRMINKILIVILLISCTSESKNIVIDTYQRDFNQIVNEIVLYRFNSASVVQIETMPIYKTVPIDSCYLETHDNLPPPPHKLIDFSKDFFDAMIERNLINSLDAEFMHLMIDSSLILNIDSNFISKPTLSKRYLDSLFNKDLYNSYDYLEKNYGSSCFIRVGTPVYNKERIRYILAVDYYCGPLSGQGFIFILEKKNDQWMIIEELGTWVS